MDTVNAVRPQEDSGRLLAGCHGYVVAASDGLLGEVETPVFPPDSPEPDYLVVRVGAAGQSRLPVIPTSLIQEVNPERRLVRVRGTREELAQLPENLPVVAATTT